MSTIAEPQAIQKVLSAARLSTFQQATVTTGSANLSAIELYAWNARLSAAMLAPLHICEVATRNAVSDALSAVYGDRWPWSPVFETSLPSPGAGYNPRRDLRASRSGALSTGKVIPELKFVFWQKMFTSRHDIRIWNGHLKQVLPNLDKNQPVSALRERMYDDLEHLRILRNRIAHHEPIFKRNLTDDFDRIASVINHRCKVTAAWMIDNQDATKRLRRLR